MKVEKSVNVIGTVASGKWYKIKFGEDSKSIGYVPVAALEKYTPVKSSSTLEFTEIKDEYTMTKGSKGNIEARVSSNYPIRTITVKTGNKTWPDRTFKQLYAQYVLVQESVGVDLSKFGAGTFKYEYTVEDISGNSITKTGTIVNSDSGVKTPEFTVENKETGKTVTIKNISGGKLYYSINGGSTKSSTDSKVLVNITKAGTTKIKAFIWANNETKRSANVVKTYTVTNLEPPVFDKQQSGKKALVTIKSADSKASIKYKINDGTYQVYDGSILELEGNSTISAYAYRLGEIKSEVVTEETELTEPSAPQIKLTNTDSKIAQGGTATVCWDKDRSAEKYTAVLYGASGNAVEEKSVTETTASFTLPEAGEYEIEVTAENEIGQSEASERVKVTAIAPFTVRFISDEKVISEVKVAYGEKAEAIPAPSKKGHTFEGWENSNTNVVSLNAYTKTEVKENTDYVATYSKNTYKIKLYDTDGNLIETQDVKYGEAVSTEGINVKLNTGYVFAGWHVSYTSDGNSAADIENVDSDMEVRAVASWADKELPIVLNVKSAEQSEDGKYINADISMVSHSEDDLGIYLVAALKVKDSTTGVEKTVYADRKIVYIDAGDNVENSTTMKMKADAKGISSIEITAMQCNDDLSTGSAYSKTVSAPITISKNWGEWSEWSTTKPDDAEDRDIEKKTEYRISDKVYTYSGYDTLEGYTKEGTETVSSTYGKWLISKPAAAAPAVTSAYKTTTNIESRTGYRWYSYYCDCGKTCWKNTGGSHGSCGSNTDNTLIVYAIKNPTSYDASDMSYNFPKTITQSNSGPYVAIYWGGGRVESFTTKASTGITYMWKSGTFERTIYRNNYVKTRNKFSKWGDWSAWGDTEYTASSTRKVETREVYRYRDLEKETSGSISLDPNGNLTRNFNGNINVSEDLNGKVATIMVYQANNTDPNKYQMQYLGQTQIGEGNSYDFSFIPKREPTVNTGNYIVSLGVQGSTGLITVGLVEAPVKEHNVSLYYKDASGNRIPIGEVQTIKNNGDVDLSNITVPERKGYYFVGWSERTTNITSSCDIEAIYAPVPNTVVFVDWINKDVSMQKVLTGESIELPGSLVDSNGHKFVGWKLEDGTVVDPDTTKSVTVSGDMIIEAVYETIEYTVNFKTESGTVVESQKVKYGEAAQPPAYTSENGTFVGWNTDVNWWRVEKDTDVYPIIVYNEAALKPEARTVVDPETDEVSIELTTEEESAEIYYTVDGTVPTAESILELKNTTASEYIGNVEQYTEPLSFEEETCITSVTYIEGKNESETCITQYSPDPENIDEEHLLDGEWEELGTYDVKVAPGKDVTVDVGINENTGLTGCDFLLVCDEETFYVDTDEYDEPVCDRGPVTENGILSARGTADGIRVTWVTDEASAQNGELFKMTLHVEEGTEEGKYPVSVCYAPETTLDSDFLELEPSKIAISVKSQASINIGTYEASLARDTYVYEGKAIEPAVSIQGLKEGEDYKVTYTNNVEVGTANILIEGIGGYEGSLEKTFNITAANIGNADITGITDAEYTGSPITPEPEVSYSGIKLEKGKDYEVSYANNKAIGTASVIVTGKGNYTGSTSVNFQITKSMEAELEETKALVESLKAQIAELMAQIKELSRKDLIRAEVETISAKTYTGSAIEPALTVTYKGVTLEENVDYVVAYTNNVKVGKAQVLITGIGDYKESIGTIFKINPKSTKITSLTRGSKRFTVKWSKVTTQVTGYQVRYSRSSSMSSAKTSTITSYKTTTKTVKSLKAKKKYYVQVRTYKTVNGVKYYSTWSAKKSIVTK